MASAPPLSSAGDADSLPVDVAELFAFFKCTPAKPIKFHENYTASRRYRLDFTFLKGKKGRQRIKPQFFGTRADAVQHMSMLLNNLTTKQPQKANNRARSNVSLPTSLFASPRRRRAAAAAAPSGSALTRGTTG